MRRTTDQLETMDTGAGFDMASPQSIRSAVGLALSSLVRSAPVWLAAGFIGLGLLTVITGTRSDDPRATAELSVTDEVVWPFFEGVLSTSRAGLVSFEPSARRLLGEDLVAYEVTQPDNVGLVTLEVTATTEEAAVAAARAAAAAVIEADRADQVSVLDARIAELEVVDADATATIETYVQELQALTQQFTPGITEAARRTIDQQIQVIQAERDSALRRQSAAREQLDEIRVERNSSSGRIELTSIDSTNPGARSSRPLRVAGAIGVALAAAIVCVIVLREQGRIRDEFHVRSVMGLPTLRFPERSTDAVALSRLLHSVADPGTERVVGVSSVPTGPDSTHQLTVALKEIGEDVAIAEFGLFADTSHSLSLPLLDPLDDSTVDAQLASDTSLVTVNAGRTTMRELRRRIAELDRQAIPVLAVMIRREL